MPPLNNLTLEQLTQLTSDLREIEDAGRLLHAAGLEPVFDLTPGAPIMIYTNAVMPGAADHGQPVHFSMEVTGLDDGEEPGGGRTIAEWLSIFDGAFAEYQAGFQMMQTQVGDAIKMIEEALQPPQMIVSGKVPDMADRIHSRAARIVESGGAVEIDNIPSFLKRESTEAPSDAPDAEPVDAPPALGEVAGGAPISAEPSRSDEDAGTPKVAAEPEAKAESGGGAEVAAPKAPAAPVPGSASALAASTLQWAGAWTDAEDANLIDAMASAIIAGKAKADAIRDLSAANGRSFKAVEQRSYRLNPKIKAEVSLRATAQAQTETPEIPPAEVAVAPVPEDVAAGGHSPAAVPETTPEALGAAFDRKVDAMPDLHGDDLRVWQFVAAHRAKWPHTAGTDLDLAVGLGRGEKIGLIAVDLGIDVKALQQRWDCLSTPIRNAQGKITIDGMPRLINILRRIAKAPAAAA